MAEATGTALAEELETEEAVNEKLFEVENRIEELPPQPTYEFHDTPGKEYHGILIRNEHGVVVDYMSNAGSMRAACEAMPGGAPIEKVLSLYIKALDGKVVRHVDNPENAFTHFEHTITSSGDRITIEVREVPKEIAKNGNEKKLGGLSPAELAKKAEDAKVEAAWNMATSTPEFFHHEEAVHETSEPKVVSVEEGRRIFEARRAGIGLAGLPSTTEAAPRTEAEQPEARSTMQAYALSPQEDVANDGESGTSLEEAYAALQELRQAA